MAPPAQFCPLCGRPLATADACARDGCGWRQYRDPKLAVVALVRDDSDRLLYIRRNHEPAMYQWCWPSGFVDAGERVEDAAAREVREETGVEAAIEELLGVWSQQGDDVVVLAYSARQIGGTLHPGPEALAAGWFPEQQQPGPVFAHDAAIRARSLELARRAQG